MPGAKMLFPIQDEPMPPPATREEMAPHFVSIGG